MAPVILGHLGSSRFFVPHATATADTTGTSNPCYGGDVRAFSSLHGSLGRLIATGSLIDRPTYPGGSRNSVWSFLLASNPPATCNRTRTENTCNRTVNITENTWNRTTTEKDKGTCCGERMRSLKRRIKVWREQQILQCVQYNCSTIVYYQRYCKAGPPLQRLTLLCVWRFVNIS